MINLDIEEIKKKLSYHIQWFYSLYSLYDWIEYHDNTQEKKYVNTPVFDLPDNDDISIVGSESAPYIGAVCFGRFTRHYSRRRLNGDKTWFRIKMLTKPRHPSEDNKIGTNNLCWANEEQVKFWLDTCKQETSIQFDYRVETGEDNSIDITYDFYNLPLVQIKFVLFWTRYLYECPANLHVIDAIILKRDYFPEESMINLLTLVSMANSVNRVVMSSSQCLTSCGGFSSLSRFRRLLDQVNYTSDLFTGMDFGYKYCASLDYKNSYNLALKDSPEILEPSLIITPFYTGENSYMKNYLSPVQDWLEKEDRFSRYIPLYEFLKKHERNDN